MTQMRDEVEIRAMLKNTERHIKQEKDPRYSGPIVDEIEDAYNLKMAYDKASEIAEKNGWTLVKVEPKVYPPTPQIIYPRRRPRDDWPDVGPIIRG